MEQLIHAIYCKKVIIIKFLTNTDGRHCSNRDVALFTFFAILIACFPFSFLLHFPNILTIAATSIGRKGKTFQAL